jgi:hypothetical protein
MGFDTNNSTEIWGLIKGVQMALDHNLTRLIIEGDSKVIIDLATKIINGKDPEKITPSWCLLGPLNSLKALLRPSLTLTTSHIRRSTNKVADRLANANLPMQGLTQNELLLYHVPLYFILVVFHLLLSSYIDIYSKLVFPGGGLSRGHVDQKYLCTKMHVLVS